MQQWAIIYEFCQDHTDCDTHGTYRMSPGADAVAVVPAFIPIEVPAFDLRTVVHTAPSAQARHARKPFPVAQFLGILLLALGTGGFVGPMIPQIRLESGYFASKTKLAIARSVNPAPAPLPKSAPVVFNPLVTPNGASIAPVNTDFSLVVPSIGINAPIVADVDPTKRSVYAEALQDGIAHASTSFLPDQNGTTYLFSHDTNYDWFVKDLNAVFYLLKNVKQGDLAVIFYKGKRYTYQVTEKKVVSPTSTQYLFPVVGKKSLILETCWPPGSTAERLLIFAKLVEDGGVTI